MATRGWETGCEFYEKLRFETAQLDLIAGRPVREVAAKLIRAHESPQHWLRPATGANELSRTVGNHSVEIGRLRAELTDKTRADFGLSTSPPTPPDSIQWAGIKKPRRRRWSTAARG
jgi:hypothetical protein